LEYRWGSGNIRRDEETAVSGDDVYQLRKNWPLKQRWTSSREGLPFRKSSKTQTVTQDEGQLDDLSDVSSAPPSELLEDPFSDADGESEVE